MNKLTRTLKFKSRDATPFRDLKPSTGMDVPEAQRARLCRENIERLKAFKASPPPAPAQKDYKTVTLTATMPYPKNSAAS